MRLKEHLHTRNRNRTAHIWRKVISMVEFDHYAVVKVKNYIAFSASAAAVVELVGTVEIVEDRCMPQKWSDALRARIDFAKYDQYSVCICEKTHGNYNRLTDYKGVWGLAELPRGIAEHAYMVERGKVYWGILQTPDAWQWQIISDVCILLPRGCSFPEDGAKQLWEEARIGFDVRPDKDFFRKLLKIMPEAVLMHFTTGLDYKLELFGLQVEDLFDAD